MLQIMNAPFKAGNVQQTFTFVDVAVPRSAGGGAWQTPFERTAAPGYERRADVAVATLTLQLPLEGKLARGGMVGVVKLADGRWLHAQAGGAQQDFYFSTREVRACSLHSPVQNLLYVRIPYCKCWSTPEACQVLRSRADPLLHADWEVHATQGT